MVMLHTFPPHSMKRNMTAAATKRDFALLKRDLVDRKLLQQELAGTEQSLRREITDLEKRLRRDLVSKEDLVVLKDEIIDGVRFLNENTFHNFQGAFHDKTSLLNDKVYAHDMEIAGIKRFLKLR